MSEVEFIFGAKPKVKLLHATPPWVVAMATRGYTGNYTGSITSEEVKTFWKELGNTKLKGPLEMAQTFWLLEDVTRAFTHQLARYRQGISIVQESQRFTIQGEGEQSNPPKVVVPRNISSSQHLVESFCEEAEECFKTYWHLINKGIPVEDARGLLPTNTCTRLYVNISILTLKHIYEQRMCCQAQAEEWHSVCISMERLLGDSGYYEYQDQLKAPWEDPKSITCGFGASFDRPCERQTEFDINLIEITERKWSDEISSYSHKRE